MIPFLLLITTTIAFSSPSTLAPSSRVLRGTPQTPPGTGCHQHQSQPVQANEHQHLKPTTRVTRENGQKESKVPVDDQVPKQQLLYRVDREAYPLKPISQLAVDTPPVELRSRKVREEPQIESNFLADKIPLELSSEDLTNYRVVREASKVEKYSVEKELDPKPELLRSRVSRKTSQKELRSHKDRDDDDNYEDDDDDVYETYKFKRNGNKVKITIPLSFMKLQQKLNARAEKEQADERDDNDDDYDDDTNYDTGYGTGHKKGKNTVTKINKPYGKSIHKAYKDDDDDTTNYAMNYAMNYGTPSIHNKKRKNVGYKTLEIEQMKYGNQIPVSTEEDASTYYKPKQAYQYKYHGIKREEEE